MSASLLICMSIFEEMYCALVWNISSRKGSFWSKPLPSSSVSTHSAFMLILNCRNTIPLRIWYRNISFWSNQVFRGTNPRYPNSYTPLKTHRNLGTQKFPVPRIWGEFFSAQILKPPCLSLCLVLAKLYSMYKHVECLQVCIVLRLSLNFSKGVRGFKLGELFLTNWNYKKLMACFIKKKESIVT